MKSLSINEVKFNDLPLFDGAKGFSVVYLEGEFHLFYAVNGFMKGCVMHLSSVDGYLWQRKEMAVTTTKRINSVTAHALNGKIYLYYLTYNIFGLTDLYLTVSKDGEVFLPLPNALVKNTKLLDLKGFFSEGMRYLMGSEIKGGIVPLYSSMDGKEWTPFHLFNKVEEGEVGEYLGAPSPFVAYDKTLIAYSMLGAKVAECEVDIQNGTISLHKVILETYAEVIRSVMVREATPILFLGCGCAVVPVEVYYDENGIAFRLFREVLNGAKLRVDNGVEENGTMPSKLVREQGILHSFTIKNKSGTVIEFGGATLEIGENGEFILDGDVELYLDGETLSLNVIDEGNLIVVEIGGGVYPIPAGISEVINVNVTDYQYESYKL